MDHNPERRRGNFHRSRRGSDRRGSERRTPPQEQPGRDQVDVEQIMREIRSRIAQRHGIELSTQQIQELAARRLEAILDPRGIDPALLEQMRRSAGRTAGRLPASAAVEPPYTFEETTLYDSHRGLLRFFRKLLNPILKLFFNPNPLIRALNVQARLNREQAEREAEREQRQAEWNALHYELLQRMITEVARASLELQAQSLRLESLAAKIDFNDRRVRAVEGSLHQPRPADRPAEVAAPAGEAPGPDAFAEAAPADGTRRRRRRRRGRRGAGLPGEGQQPAAAGSATSADTAVAESDADTDVLDTDDAEGDTGEREPAEAEFARVEAGGAAGIPEPAAAPAYPNAGLEQPSAAPVTPEGEALVQRDDNTAAPSAPEEERSDAGRREE